MKNTQNEVRGGYQPYAKDVPQNMRKAGDGYQPLGTRQSPPPPPPPPPKGGTGANIPAFKNNPNNTPKK